MSVRFINNTHLLCDHTFYIIILLIKKAYYHVPQRKLKSYVIIGTPFQGAIWHPLSKELLVLLLPIYDVIIMVDGIPFVQ